MAPEFEIQVDPSIDLVKIRLAGFFDDRAMRAFLAAREREFQRLRCPANAHLSLTDVREMAIQGQDIVARWGAVLADPAYRSRRLAFIIASTLVRTQVQRAIGTRDARVFLDPAQAEGWVLAARRERRAA